MESYQNSNREDMETEKEKPDQVSCCDRFLACLRSCLCCGCCTEEESKLDTLDEKIAETAAGVSSARTLSEQVGKESSHLKANIDSYQTTSASDKVEINNRFDTLDSNIEVTMKDQEKLGKLVDNATQRLNEVSEEFNEGKITNQKSENGARK